MKRYDEVENFKVYGNSGYEYAFIADEHKGMIDWDIKDILIGVIDLEVSSDNGFPEPKLSNEPITAITIKYVGGKTYTFGCGEYQIEGDEIYVKCENEYTLCQRFLSLWSEQCPDVVSGWNSVGFDIPYIINRFNKILGEEATKRLSPWNIINERERVSSTGKEYTTYTI
jgi:DNA polymerase elongation subunit (family B)